MIIKAIIDEQYVGMNSGWPTRYIGLIKQMCRYSQVNVYAPGDTTLLQKALPMANVCSSTPIPKIVRKKTPVVGYVSALIIPGKTLPNKKTLLSSNLKNLLSKEPKSDVSVYFGIYTYPYYRKVDKSIKRISDFCDSMERHFRSRQLPGGSRIRDKIIMLYDIACLSRYKKFNYSKSVEILSIAEKDASYIRKKLRKVKVHVVPNGVDIPVIADKPAYYEKKWDSKIILFVGSLSYEPNIISLSFILKEIWPIMSEQFSDYSFHIVGRGKSDKFANTLSQLKNVKLIGEVEDVMPYFMAAKCLFAPFFSGGGMKNKFLEAFSTGTPVITNTEGAIGIDFQEKYDSFVGRDNFELISLLKEVITCNKSKYVELVECCLKISYPYSWDSVGDQFNKIVTKI